MNEAQSIWTLIREATPIVQGVMLILFLLSVISWAIILERLMFFFAVRRLLEHFEYDFWSGIDLNALYREGKDDKGIENIFRAGFREFSRLRERLGHDADALMDGVQRAMRAAQTREGERLDASLTFLATVGSTSPYIGLFGTVWGIMNSFRGLAEMQQATLAVVAPGISEALIATAMGLFAAIPAVIAYNRFTAQSGTINNRYETFVDEFSNILYRWAHASGN